MGRNSREHKVNDKALHNNVLDNRWQLFEDCSPWILYICNWSISTYVQSQLSTLFSEYFMTLYMFNSRPYLPNAAYIDGCFESKDVRRGKLQKLCLFAPTDRFMLACSTVLIMLLKPDLYVFIDIYRS